MSQFKGVKVLELASVLAGPSVGQFFAELGADVIKVENLNSGGDVTRGWKSVGEKTDDRSAYFCSVNWGKRSIALNLATIEGKEIVQKLASKSEIVIASYKPGDAEKLGVDYQTLSKNNAGLIYGQVTGYGSGNRRVGYDAIIQAESGFMFMNGEPGGSSLKMPVALMDILAGHHMKEGLLLALLEKTISGSGKLVEVSLIQAAISSLANQATNYLVANKLPQKQGSAHPNIAPYGDVFITSDGKEILLAVGSDQQFANLCKILKINYLNDNHKFMTNAARVENREELKGILSQAFSKLESDKLLKDIHIAKIPASVIQNVKQALEMPEANELLLNFEGLKGLKTFAVHPVKTSSHFLPPPHFGEHTREILQKFLNFSQERIDGLLQKQIIA